MNYRDFFKNKKATAKDIQNLIPEGVDQQEFNMGIDDEKEHTDNEFVAAKIAGDHLKGDSKYYSKLKKAGLEEGDCDCGAQDGSEHGPHSDDCGVYKSDAKSNFKKQSHDMRQQKRDRRFYDEPLSPNVASNVDEDCGECEEDEIGGEDYDDNGGLPKVGGALAVPHLGQPIMMSKIINVGGIGGGPASGEQSGMTACGGKGVTKDSGGVPVQPQNDSETITAGGKKVDGSIASKSVGGEVVPGEGQKQGGKNSCGTIASTSKLTENKQRVRQAVKQVLKEIRFNKGTGKWEKINEEAVNMKMGASYKVVQPRQYKVMDDDVARTNQYEPEITEMCDEEEQTKMNERYVELANEQRNLNADELNELKGLREKLDKLDENDYEHPDDSRERQEFQRGISKYNKRNPGRFECPTCKTPNALSADQQRKGYQCDRCADSEEGTFQETVNMKMGPSYKTVQPRMYKVSDDDVARNNQYQHDMSENEEKINCPQCSSGNVNVLSHDENPEGGGSAECNDCGNTWNTTDELGQSFPDNMSEAGGQSVQHKSFRTANDVPQNPKIRWDDEVNEGKESKVAKTIKKGMKTNKTQKNPHLKFQKSKKTSSGVHKRKT